MKNPKFVVCDDKASHEGLQIESHSDLCDQCVEVFADIGSRQIQVASFLISKTVSVMADVAELFGIVCKRQKMRFAAESADCDLEGRLVFYPCLQAFGKTNNDYDYTAAGTVGWAGLDAARGLIETARNLVSGVRNGAHLHDTRGAVGKCLGRRPLAGKLVPYGRPMRSAA